MKLLRWLDKHFEESLMLILLALMVCIMGLQVFMRYVMQNSLAWPEEITRYMFIWFVFLGISYGIRNDIHIRVNLLETFFPKITKPLNILQDLIFFAFLAYLVNPSISIIKLIYNSQQHSPAMQVPMVVVYFSLFLGIYLGLFRMIQKYFLIFTGKYQAPEKDDDGVLG